jgi:hypothetical protein
MSLTLTTMPNKGNVVNEQQCFTVEADFKNTLSGIGCDLVDVVAEATIVNHGNATGKFYGKNNTTISPSLNKTILCPFKDGIAYDANWKFSFDVITGLGGDVDDKIEVEVKVKGWNGFHYFTIIGPIKFKNWSSAYKKESASIIERIYKE